MLYPGGRHRAQRLAAYDLPEQRVRGDDADLLAGVFNTLVEEMAGYSALYVQRTSGKRSC